MPDIKTQKAEEIFCDAYELPDSVERKAFIARACGDDRDLLATVEKMLRTQVSADTFFAESIPALEPPTEVKPSETSLRRQEAGETVLDEKPGTRIGPYRILEKLGEGGCGAVYMAEQEEPVRRMVALKILKLGMDTKSVIARFQAEQQALALMDHPNIAHVHDAGVTEKGRPYFIMELVRGIRLTAFCDHHCLDARQRMKLFIQVCNAIQHAHQKGIIHRDIKPSNILVMMHDGVPVPKVIDFGIAKAVEGKLADETYFTAQDQFIGTPAYMSPEQAERSALDVDTRTDIYSLGVLLYELLTGRTPFDTTQLLKAGMDELRRTLREREPQRPSTAVATLKPDDLTQAAQRRHAEPVKLISMLRGDLDWIVMKSLEKDRSRRYQTANGLAMDVQRYLDNEPILARPPSQFYRFQKLVRRNKIVFAASSITLIALIASSAISTWLLVKERIARDRALLAEQQKGKLEKEASTLRENAEKHRKVSEALALYEQGKTQQADAILDGLTNPPASQEYASMFRTLGDNHALAGEWWQAKARLDALAQINELSGADTTMDDIRCAVLLVDQDHLGDYERFRESLVTRYAGTDNVTASQRILRCCLLTPASDELLNSLNRFAGTVDSWLKKTNSDPAFNSGVWESYALALMDYRRGDYNGVLDLCERTKLNRGFVTRDFSVRLIRAMAYKQLGQEELAKTELTACRSGMKKALATPPVGKEWQGFWFDKASLQIHLREATELIEGSPGAKR